MGGVDEQTTRIAREPVPILDLQLIQSQVVATGGFD
jgi:hypothetical protein